MKKLLVGMLLLTANIGLAQENSLLTETLSNIESKIITAEIYDEWYGKRVTYEDSIKYDLDTMVRNKLEAACNAKANGKVRGPITEKTCFTSEREQKCVALCQYSKY